MSNDSQGGQDPCQAKQQDRPRSAEMLLKQVAAQNTCRANERNWRTIMAQMHGISTSRCLSNGWEGWVIQQACLLMCQQQRSTVEMALIAAQVTTCLASLRS